ncbi:uncharacterized protein LOC119306268 [Triticum dicoccoides]|uniref:uncharacterized protein LOC119306268 n=1 Tax=Triticum dicoccoides TaxID=85692 RepID=UPI00188FBC7C|nr:uncharacterized protein LOC119306268 [Triticum dicoccoides]
MPQEQDVSSSFKDLPNTRTLDGPSPRRYPVLRFDVPTIDGREIVSVDSSGIARFCVEEGPLIFVDQVDGKYYIARDRRLPGEPFESVFQLIQSAGLQLLAAFSHLPPYEEQQHVRGNASSQMPALELEASCDLPCEESSVAETGSAHSAQMLQPITATSSASVQADAAVTQEDTVHVSPPLLRFLSSSPIWGLRRGDWGYAFFYIRIDLKGSFHTYPPVGGPFQSLEQACSAIDRHLEEQRHPTMFMDQPGMSQVDKVIRQCLYWPDGTRKKLIDERRDWMRQLVQALLDKYNDYNHLLGDPTYKLKDVVCFESVHAPNDHTRLYHHINFTAKTKGADDDSNCGIEDLFFAELMWERGERIELVVSCFCVLKPTDNGRCDACDAKHPNDAAYTHQISPLGEYAKLGNIVYVGYDEDLKEEEERVRRHYEGRDDPEGMNRKLTTIQT